MIKPSSGGVLFAKISQKFTGKQLRWFLIFSNVGGGYPATLSKRDTGTVVTP